MHNFEIKALVQEMLDQVELLQEEVESIKKELYQTNS